MRRNWGMFLYALLGGFCIGLGGTAFLRIKDSFTGGVVVGALFFAIGLFTICTRGYNLSTTPCLLICWIWGSSGWAISWAVCSSLPWSSAPASPDRRGSTRWRQDWWRGR